MSLVQSNEFKYFIHNHYSFLVKYNKDAQTDLARIVAFEVKPFRLNISSSQSGVSLWCSHMLHDRRCHFTIFFFYVHSDSVHLIIYCICRSLKHEFDGDWKGNATRLKTCNTQSEHLIVNSDGPEEVKENKEIIFTYDVNFEVVSTFDYSSGCFYARYNQPCF